jgi:putative ABC transport system permease protein
MNFAENIREAIRAIRSNMLRSTFTALIIMLGIISLVGNLVAVDALQNSVSSNFANLGVNSFDIKGPQTFRRRREGVSENKVPPISYREAVLYKQNLSFNAVISLYTSVTGNAEVKHGSKKTNPNARVVGIDENYLDLKGYKLSEGRNFTKYEEDNAIPVAIIGQEIKNQIFPKEAPVDKEVTFLGQKIKVIGLLDKKGSLNGSTGNDRVVMLPLQLARNIAGERRRLTIDITTSTPDISDLDMTMGEARKVMRQVRQDPLGAVDSFSIQRADSLKRELDDITGTLQGGGLIFALITLLGAAIALINIMLVSVTERTREIGIRKSLGATPARIREQFLIEAIVICILGGLAGVFIVLTVGNAIIVATTGQFIVPWMWMATGLITCLVVGALAGFYPAYKASKLDPIESLRYE